MAEAYHEAGIRRESGGKTEINIAKEAEVEINSIKDGDLPDDVKSEHIKEIEKNRDAAIKNTKQGVLLNLRANIDNLSNKLESDKLAQKDNPENSANIANIKQQVDRLGERLNPNDENLKDQIDKADQDLTAMIKDNTGNEFEGDLRNIRDKFRDTWQKTSDQLQRQALIDKSNSALKETERRLNSGQYTQIPTTEYDAESDLELAKLDAKEKAAYANLSAMRKKAAEKANTNTVDKLLTLRRSWLIASFGAIEKVGISAITKPIIDPFNKQTFGRISGAITGVRRTKGGLLSDTYRQFKNQGSAEAFMKSRNDDYIASIQDYEKAVNSFGADSKEAKKAQTNLLKREVANSASIAHLFINANSLVDIKQVLVNAATNLDASLGKYEKSTRAERKAEQQQQYGNSYKKALAESGYWLEGLNRTHGAMKSVSARQGLLDGYIQNLQYFQKKEGSITEETRKLAWDKAVLSDYEIGRFGETTWASKKVSELKGGKNPIKRAVVSYALPVAKISINITKQAIDRALPLEVIVRTMGTDAMKGIKKNEADGIQYKNFIEKYGAGIKRGFDELPYEQKKYINTLISRGLAGAAQYAVVYSMISSGAIKYGGAWNTNDPYHRKYGRVIGSDGNELKNGEWEFFGHRSPLILNAALNHSPYALPASLAADWAFQTNRLDKSGNPVKNAVSNAVRTGINEVYSRLPFTTVMDIVAGLIGGDDYKAARLGASIVPGSKGIAEHFDKDKNGETVKRTSNSKTFLGRVKDMAAMDIPGARNFLPTDKAIAPFDVIDKKSGIKRQITDKELDKYTSDKKEGLIRGMKTLSDSKNYSAIRKNEQGKEELKENLNFKDLTDKEKQTYITTMKNDVVKTIKEKMFGEKNPSGIEETLKNSIEIKKTEIKNR